MKMLVVASLSVALIATSPDQARACGHCHGDLIASVYDGSVVVAAHKAGKCVIYLGIEGAYGMTLNERLEIGSVIVSINGVVRRSAFIAETNPAARALFDPRKTNGAKIALEATGVLRRTKDVSLKLLQSECPATK